MLEVTKYTVFWAAMLLFTPCIAFTQGAPAAVPSGTQPPANVEPQTSESSPATNTKDLQKSIEGLRNDIKGLKNDPSKYWLLLIGGGVGIVGSVLTSVVTGYLAKQNKEMELQALSIAKTKELLFNQVAGFEGKTQPRSAVLAAISAFQGKYLDLHPLFRVFLVSQLEHLITHGDNTPLEQSNAVVILQLGSILNFTVEDKQRIKIAWTNHPNGSAKGLKMNAEAEKILATY